MRFAAVLLFVLAACGSSEPAPPPAPSAPPSSATTPTSAPVEPSTPAERPAPAEAVRTPRDVAREAAEHVRQGRHAARAERFVDALSAFDRALALVPRSPRVLCESGFVAHRAGDEADAARRIDRALRVFGPPEHVSEALREPLAMCLYNRGLVAEALTDREGAAAHYERSLALRPNATVRAALERVAPTGVAEPSVEDEHVLAADDLEAVVDLLRRRMRGTDEDEVTPVPAAHVAIRERPVRPDGARQITILDVDSADAHYPVQSLVVVERIGSGHRVSVLEIGSVDSMVSGTEGDVRLLMADTRWEGDVLVLHVARSTDLGTWDSTEVDGAYCTEERQHSIGESFLVFCAPNDVCRSLEVEESDSGESLHRECEPAEEIDEDEGGIEGDGATTVQDVVVSEPTSSRVEVRIEGRELVLTGEEPDRISIADLEPLPGPPPE